MNHLSPKTLPAITFEQITKSFGALKANDHISFQVQKGTIHALIGENGAGKSTLMSILFGLIIPDYGKIKVHGITRFIANPKQANNLGIGMVHQHFKLIDAFSAWENIVLGQEITNKYNLLLKNEILKKIKGLQQAYQLTFDLHQKVRNTDVATKQKIEIMKMLYAENDIIILDEPTAVLAEGEISSLLQTISRFKSQGKTIIFISHKLKEVLQIADSATVLRLGKVVAHYDSLKGVSAEQLAAAMIGKNTALITNAGPKSWGKKVVFEFHNVSTKGVNGLKKLSFQLHQGEILAIAGVSGNGQEDLELVAYGLKFPTSGKVFKYNHNHLSKNQQLTSKRINLTYKSVSARYKNGISYIPGDRHKYGVVLDFNVADNVILRSLTNQNTQKYGWINQKNKEEFSKQLITKYDVRGANQGRKIIRNLSGGNQQKLVVGREMETQHDLLIIVQPTRGLDFQAANSIYRQILAQKAANKAILLISYDINEILNLADQILVISQGAKMGICHNYELDLTKIGLMMAGHKDN